MSMQFVAYYRVSTRKQGRSGLGLEAQKEAVSRHLKTSGGKLVASFQEVESGKNNNRIQLHYALEEARKHRATVIIAKLDRLGRRASYILRLIDESGVNFHICDMPNADKLTITILAAVAEQEATNARNRTKAACDAKRARGEQMGSPYLDEVRKLSAAGIQRSKEAFQKPVLKVIEEIVIKGKVRSQSGIAEALNARGIPTALKHKRKSKWHSTTVQRLLGKSVQKWVKELEAA